MTRQGFSYIIPVMMFTFPGYSLAFFLGSVLAVILACAVYMRRPAAGVRYLTYFALACALWTLAAGMESGATQYATNIFWSQVEYIGLAFSGVCWLLFALEYAGSAWCERARYRILLWAVPAATIILAWTNDWHHWVWSRIYYASSFFGIDLIYEHGFWFWILVAYQYLVISAGMWILWRFVLKKAVVYRWQIGLLVMGTLIPMFGSIIYLLNFNFIRGLDIIPFTFVFAGIVYAVAIFYFRFLDVIPVARSTLVENMPEGIIVLDVRGEIVDINSAAGQMKGLDFHSLLGKKLETVWPELDQMLAKPGQSQHAVLAVEVFESKTYLDVSLTVLKNKRGSVVGRLVMLTDITDLKLIQQKLEFSNEEERRLRQSLQEEMEKRSKYSRTLVHELKTPLTAILASSELLESEIKEQVFRDLVQNIRRSSLNLESRINELLELARGEIGLLKIKAEPLDLQGLLREIISEMAPVAVGKGLTMVSEISELPLVSGDGERLRQVVSNLLSNAFKFTPRGMIRVIAKVQDPDFVLVQVKDSGKGIENTELENLFDPYRRISNDQTQVGLGIGLALSKILVDLHQGKIWVESTPDKGSTFSFTVPIYK